MKKLYTLSILFIAISINAIAQLPNYHWAKNAGGMNDDEGNSIVTDSNGNSYVTGYFSSPSIIFGNDTVTNKLSNGSADIFVVKYDEYGNVLWARSAGGTSSDYANCISVDANGNIFITGYFLSSTLVFGNDTLLNSGSGIITFFIAKYDGSGNILWARKNGTTGGSPTVDGKSICNDPNGNVFVTGSYYGWPNKPIFGNDTLNSPGGYDFFVVKYDSSGTVIWAKGFGGPGYDYGNGITADAVGNILLTGSFASNEISFDSITLYNINTNSDIFIAKFDPSGNILWANSAGGTGGDGGNAITTDMQGNVLVTGNYGSTSISFGSIVLSGLGGSSSFVVKYDSTGNTLWAQGSSVGSTHHAYSKSIGSDAAGNVFITGNFCCYATFGNVFLVGTSYSEDIFLVKYDATGNLVWVFKEGGSGEDQSNDIAVDSQGNVLYTGFFKSGSLELGVYNLNNANSGTADVFVAKLCPLSISISAVNVSCNGANDGAATAIPSGGNTPYTFLWSNNDTAAQSGNLSLGNYSVTVTEANGCAASDSVAITQPAAFTLSFSANPQTGVAPLNVAFNNTTPNLNNYDFTWYFGDGSDSASDASTVFHTYTFSGFYDVALLATDTATGCTDTLVKPGFIQATGPAGCTHTAIIYPTGPVNACTGDTVALTLSTDASAPYTIQWNINSTGISGATDTVLQATQSGSYTVIVIKNGCPVISSAVQVYLNIPAVPAISGNGFIPPCSNEYDTLTSSFINGGTYLWNTGDTTQTILVNNSGSYHVTVTDSYGCSNYSAPFEVNASIASTPPICLVTVDSASNKNKVVWEKQIVGYIDSFRVYREIIGNYTYIGAVSYNDLSLYQDTTSGINADITSYRYKISAVDTCGNESPLSQHHKTIHLTVNQGIPPALNLIWDGYQGFTSNFYYRIIRYNNGVASIIDSVSNTVFTYTDPQPPAGNIYYAIEVVHPGGGCEATVKVAENHNSSRSNVKLGIMQGASVNEIQISDFDFKIYPNPNDGTFTIEFNNFITSLPYHFITIYNVLGEVVFKKPITDYRSPITLKQAAGIYNVQLVTEKGVANKKLVIE